MRRTFFAALPALVLLAACAGAPAAPEPPVSQAIDAPVPAGVARVIARADAGARIAVAPGTKVAVALVGVPTAGYLWKPAAVPAFLTPAGEAGGPTHAAQRQPGFAGGNHWEVFVFDVQSPGEAELRFNQARPWETDEPAADSFAVTIVAE